MADDILDIEASSEELGKTAGKDEAVDKTTYPKLLGLERSKEVAQELVAEAKAALTEFGEAAAPLNGCTCLEHFVCVEVLSCCVGQLALHLQAGGLHHSAQKLRTTDEARTMCVCQFASLLRPPAAC